MAQRLTATATTRRSGENAVGYEPVHLDEIPSSYASGGGNTDKLQRRDVASSICFPYRKVASVSGHCAPRITQESSRHAISGEPGKRAGQMHPTERIDEGLQV